MVVTEEVDALRVMGLDPGGIHARAEVPGRVDHRAVPHGAQHFLRDVRRVLFLAFSIDMSLRVYFQEVAERSCCATSGSRSSRAWCSRPSSSRSATWRGCACAAGRKPSGRRPTAVVKSTFLVIVADVVATAIFYLMGWSAAG